MTTPLVWCLPEGCEIALPLLPSQPSGEEVTAYLRWLSASPFAYHLDDDPEDCGFPAGVGRVLAWNVSVLRDAAVCGDFSWSDMWNVYFPAEAGSLSDERGTI